MRVGVWLSAVAGIATSTAFAESEVSVERGLQISIIGGCHDCHTEGYSEAGGKIDPEKALRGNRVGWRGPWGTTYASNLRAVTQSFSERGFVVMLKNIMTRPPMPWYNLRASRRVICNRFINRSNRLANLVNRRPCEFLIRMKNRKLPMLTSTPRCQRTDNVLGVLKAKNPRRARRRGIAGADGEIGRAQYRRAVSVSVLIRKFSTAHLDANEKRCFNQAHHDVPLSAT